MPPIPARYLHTNLIARDWRKLVAFYEQVFGCTAVPPVRDLSGPELEKGSGVPAARLEGAHLRLPGHGDTGPTLEIFSYSSVEERPDTAANRLGFGHIAFRVPDLNAAIAAILAASGSKHGAIATTPAGQRTITWVYMQDPEGNLVELQAG